jgi:hypothetical protein
MAWQAIAVEMSALFDAAERQDFDAEVADRAEAEGARIRLVDRIAAAPAEIGLQAGGQWLRGTVAEVGADFLVLEEAARTVLVPLAGVDAVTDLPPGAREPGSEGEVAARYRLGAALRAVGRHGGEVRVVTRSAPVIGTISGVGADHLRVQRGGGGPEVVLPFAGVYQVELLG